MTGYPFLKVFNPEAKWYAGDFHLHSNSSLDGENSPAELAALGREEGLDFLALTDHNTIDGFAKIEENLDFLFIPGIEITLTKGHFNVFGMGGWRPWMEEICVTQKAIPLPEKYQLVSELMRLIDQEGLLASINHPLLHPWEWQFKRTDLNFVHCVELWNDLYWPDNAIANPKTVDLWTDWLNAGFNVVALGGSDYHYLPKPDLGLPGERLGQPATYVFAEALSAPGVLEGVRNGRAYVSRGPEISFQAVIGGMTFMIGDEVGERSGEVAFKASVINQPRDSQAQLVRNGRAIATRQLGEGAINLEFKDEIDRSSPSWYRLDIIDNQKLALAITNPIYFNYEMADASAIREWA